MWWVFFCGEGGADAVATFPFDAHTAARVRCTVLDALSLLLNKERAKENQPRGLIPLGTPQREKDAALRSAHLFARMHIFISCERGLNKAALT